MSVFHLKYRPQTLADLDLVDVAEKLKKILMAKERPQAYLFAGPKGSGKTSAARVIAKLVNCEKVADMEPCNSCSSCLEVSNGSSLDVIEIDAASNRGIEDVRGIKDKAFLLPVRLKTKVFIIDEVHMLTKEAFNALLKLIEEPPQNTLFILCTTDWQKVPETVLSRLVKIEFRKATRAEKIKSLKRVIEGEKLKVDEKMLEMIVEKSDNSFRNLQKSFNEMVLELGEDFDQKRVEEYFDKKKGTYSLEELEEDLVKGSLKKILKHFESMADMGVDFRDYRERILRYFQEKLLISLGVNSGDKSKIPVAKINQFLNLLIGAAKQEKDTDLVQLPLELAVVEFLGEDKKVGSEKPKVEENEEKVEDNLEKTEKVTVGVDVLETEWGKLLTAVKPYNHSVEAFLRSARPTKIEGGTVVLEVYYPFHKDKLEDVKNRKIVEKGLEKILGVKAGFRCILGKSKKMPLVIDNDTPMDKVSDNAELNSSDKMDEGKKDIYDVAKEIFG